MPGQRRHWSPEKVEAIRRELLVDGKTLQEIGDREGVTRERIRQIAGNLERRHPPGWKSPASIRSESRQTELKRLTENGLTDVEIATKLQLSVNYTRILRRKAGYRHTPKHSIEHDIWCALKWHELFGYTPAASDWNPSAARTLGHFDRAMQFELFRQEFSCPQVTGIRNRHGSWLNFIAKTGLTPAPRGFAARGLHSASSRRNSNWRATVPDGGWSKEAILAMALEWWERFDKEPKPSDWGVGNSFYDSGAEERLTRYKELNPPHYNSVRKYFGTFQAMLVEARKLHAK